MALDIRMYAIKTYGPVIHEFDPWFNYRATEYLSEHGWTEFFHWFDYKVWYPLGRPVGTTIYPGMQITAVALHRVLQYFGVQMEIPVMVNPGDDPVTDIREPTLSDVCAYVPVWFGAIATICLALLVYECTYSWASSAAAAFIMAIVPAHIMRSVGGGFDNESVAITAMCLTFYLWTRALRMPANNPAAVRDGTATRDSVIFGVLTGFAYINMAAAWGGFTFVLNLIAVHTAVLAILGRYSSRLHRAYSLFYIIGTMGAMRVPVIGWTPLRSMEQIAGLLTFIVLQVLEFCEIKRRREKLTLFQTFLNRILYGGITVTVLAAIAYVLLPTGYFGPLGARIRGLFVKHTRTGNPLVDSVAEHQPASKQAYYTYLQNVYYLAQVGFGLSLMRLTDSNIFLITYAAVAYFFSNKMSRLIILLGPVASALGGVAIGFAVDNGLLRMLPGNAQMVTLSPACDTGGEADDVHTQGEVVAGKKKKKSKKIKNGDESNTPPGSVPGDRVVWVMDKVAGFVGVVVRAVVGWFNHPSLYPIRLAALAYLLYFYGRDEWSQFYSYCHKFAEQSSSPQIMFKAQLRSGEQIIVDDYREGYFWLRDNTPEDARVLAWWDYGYQITGIGERTTLADGNTWNHEHIATLGRILTSPEKRAHNIAKHLADYVLVWAGGGGDDLAKSPHMARIGNSIYSDMCPNDPTCRKFGFNRDGTPTKMMKNSLLYKLTQYGYKQDVKLDPSRFEHVFTSKYHKIRIYKVVGVSEESKKWVENNRVCDAPGSWYCQGQYPPALKSLIEKRKNFAQLEDFNKEKDEEARKYQEMYHKRMAGDHSDVETDEPDAAERKVDLSGLEYYGCVDDENYFSKDKEYGGSYIASSLRYAYAHALSKDKRYVAIARAGEDGHVFAFDKIKKSARQYNQTDEACLRPCLEDPAFGCGCADHGCPEELPLSEGAEHKRRWAIYRVSDAARAAAAAAQSQAKAEL
eukprot:INCI1059.2.p1 GENE.INCI1059.2~~INCI1059.2.p1  ORF type:complete len:986 (-),score=184.27 INCI1059.2:87-2996(-)